MFENEDEDEDEDEDEKEGAENGELHGEFSENRFSDLSGGGLATR